MSFYTLLKKLHVVKGYAYIIRVDHCFMTTTSLLRPICWPKQKLTYNHFVIRKFHWLSQPSEEPLSRLVCDHKKENHWRQFTFPNFVTCTFHIAFVHAFVEELAANHQQGRVQVLISLLNHWVIKSANKKNNTKLDNSKEKEANN